jgi:hypothetical protein
MWLVSFQGSVYIEDSLNGECATSLMSLHVHQTFSIQRQVDEEMEEIHNRVSLDYR